MRVGCVCAVWASFLTVCAALAPAGAYAADTPWVEESISTHKTGSWSRMVLYNRTTGLAPFNGKGHTYTPNTPSTGDYVTVNVRMSFSELANGDPSDDDAQAAIHITSNNVFQVWTKPGWLDVAAQGITPVSNVEYAVQFIMDYKAGVYSVAVQDDRGEWRRLRSASGGQTFPLAVKANAVKAVSFEGRAQFRSLKGSYTPEKPKKRSIRPADSRQSKSNSRLGPPTVREANRTVVWGRRQSGKQIERSFGAADSRGSKSNSRLGPPTVGEANRTVVWGRRQPGRQIERLFGSADNRRRESNGFFVNKNNKEMKHGN